MALHKSLFILNFFFFLDKLHIAIAALSKVHGSLQGGTYYLACAAGSSCSELYLLYGPHPF